MDLIQELLSDIYDSLINHGGEYFRYTTLSFLIFGVLFKQRFAPYRIQLKNKPKVKKVRFEILYSSLTFIVAGIVVGLLNISVFRTQEGLFYNNFYDNISDYGWPYFVLSIFLMLIFDDTYFYWAHRLLHHPKLYRYVHRIHHNSMDPTPFTTYSFHPVEAVIFSFGQIVVLSIIPVHSLAVTTWAFMTLMNAIVIHLGYEIYPQWFTRSRLTNWKTPSTHHNMHHERGRGNYALLFTWWDQLMGTEIPEYRSTLEAIQQRKQRCQTSRMQKHHSD
jgi:sterol desaturase/sphingolipid hydroxylase (fatty acid hydroxylase superfamily)